VNGDLLPDTAAPTAAPPTDPTTPRGGLRAVATRALQLRNLSLVGVLVLLFVVGTVSSANFLTRSNMINILTLAAVIGVVTVGATFVIIGGGIDLSVGAIVAVSTVWATTLQTQSYGVFVMMLTAVLVGTVAGLLNGVLIAYGRLVPFILTLATMAGGYGLAEQLSDRKSQFITVTSFTDIAQQRPLGIPLLVYIFAVVVAVGWFVLNRTVFGRRTFAVGGNPEAARLAGLDVRRHTLALYAVSGLCCGIAAVMLAAQTNTGASTLGQGYELDSIAAVVIGGTLLAGGRGSLIGSVLGVLVFTTITNLFILNSLSTPLQHIAKGAIIVAAVLLQRRGTRTA
jgi:ribose transport system permease protein